jgi:hypothetical protein
MNASGLPARSTARRSRKTRELVRERDHVAAILIILAAAGLASYLPARRASAIDHV